MKISVVSLFPELITGFMQCGIPRKAAAEGILQVHTVNPRDFARDAHRTVDDRPFGGGPGMVMKVEPLQAAIAAARLQLGMHEGLDNPERGAGADLSAQTIYLSPQGRPYTQVQARELACCESLVLVAGRYEGVDERLLQKQVDSELSLGDYVLSGGETAAMVVIDSIARLLPGVLGCADSAAEDSFGEDGLLDHPHFTRPEMLGEDVVPEVLLSGNHKRIKQWRREQALERTWRRRPDLLETARLTESDERFLKSLRSKERGE